MFHVILFVGCVILLFVLLRWHFAIVTVSGKSMFPILNDGDRILILRRTSIAELRCGQIIVGNLPLQSDVKNTNFEAHQKKLYVKKLTGLPGDKVKINACKIPDPLKFFVSANCNQKGEYIWTIPQGHCFVQGVAPMSGDSITWGPIPLRGIRGIVFAKLSPNFHKFV